MIDATTTVFLEFLRQTLKQKHMNMFSDLRHDSNSSLVGGGCVCVHACVCDSVYYFSTIILPYQFFFPLSVNP